MRSDDAFNAPLCLTPGQQCAQIRWAVESVWVRRFMILTQSQTDDDVGTLPYEQLYHLQAICNPDVPMMTNMDGPT